MMPGGVLVKTWGVVMIRRLVGLLLLAVLIVGSSGSAVAATRTGNQLVVKISAGQVQLEPSGAVLVPLRVRCQPPLSAFELNVGVRQGDVFGSVSMLGPNVVPCDGRWHRISVSVPAEVGSFVSGPATVDVFLGAYDPVEDSDLDAVDTAAVKL
jgi:hypothetical protein